MKKYVWMFINKHGIILFILLCLTNQQEPASMFPHQLLKHIYQVSKGNIYIDGYNILLVSGPIFDGKYGIESVCDSKTSEKQEKGVLSKRHIVFPKEQILQLLNCTSGESKNQKTYFNLLVLLVGASLEIRTSALHQLIEDHLKRAKQIILLPGVLLNKLESNLVLKFLLVDGIINHISRYPLTLLIYIFQKTQ